MEKVTVEPAPPPKPKRPSGAQRRKAERAKKEARLLGESGGGEAFDVLGEPDIGDSGTALEFVRRAQLIAFAQICKSRTLPQLERWRLINEHARTLGMTADRAALEARTKKLEALLKDARQAGAVRVERGDPAKKSPNARGRRGAPRAIPDAALPEPPGPSFDGPDGDPDRPAPDRE